MRNDSYTWSYDYSDNEGVFGAAFEAKHRLPLDVSGIETGHLKSTTIINPDGSKIIQYFDRRYGETVGNMDFSEVYDSIGTLLKRSQYEYTAGVDHGSPLMFTYIDVAAHSFSKDETKKGQSASQKQLVTSKVSTIYPSVGGSDIYTTTYSQFDIYDVPKITYEHNDFNGKKRYIRRFYQHDLTYNLLSMPTTTEVSSNGSSYTEMFKTNYHSSV